MRGRSALAAVLVAMAVLWSAPATALGVPVGYPEYRSRVERARAAVVSAGKDVGREAAAESLADTVDDELGMPFEVTQGTTTVETDPTEVRALVTRLRDAASPDSRVIAAGALRTYLDTLMRALGEEGAKGARSDPELLDRLLAGRRPGDVARSDWLGDQLRIWLDRLAEWLNSLGGGGGGGTDRLIIILVLAVPALLALGVLVRALVLWRRGTTRGDKRLREADPGPVVAAAADLPEDPLAYADALAAEGRGRDALRALYGGAARRLVDAGAVRRMRTRTNAELLRDVRSAAPSVAPTLTELTDRFEMAWYGHSDPGPAGYALAREVYGDLLGQVDAAPVPGADGGGAS
ncbi:MAG: DUF4129 domain-containing protein [Coriobacteriia bacterium]|nr:DUF4129 domain-containing protein [Coriobacteriia bacterium]